MDLWTRDQWGAEYDVSGRALMTGLPVDLVFIHHTVTVPSDDPAADMRAIERIDINRFGVPSYSWVIHPTGVVLEGMGLHRGAHTIDNASPPHSFNNDAFGVSFIGNFENDTPTPEAFNAAIELLQHLVAEGHAHGDFTLSGHRDVFATACPGANLYPLIGSLRESVDQPGDDDMPLSEDDITKVADKVIERIQAMPAYTVGVVNAAVNDLAGSLGKAIAAVGSKVGADVDADAIVDELAKRLEA